MGSVSFETPDGFGDRHHAVPIIKYEPDIVVFESAERQLRYFADCVAGIPELP